MFRSIRWTLQMWHAAILASVLIVFGWVLFHFLQDATRQHIDAELSRVADRVGQSLHPAGGRFRGRGRPNREAPLAVNPNAGNANAVNANAGEAARDVEIRREEDLVAGVPRVGGEGDGPREPGPRPRLRRGVPPLRLDLAEDLKPLFEDLANGGYYYIIWHGQAEPQFKSKSAPEMILPEIPQARREGAPVRVVRQRGNFREAIRQQRFWGTNVLVGRSIEPDLAALHEKAWLLAGAGIAVLGAGLLGGHWFSRRAIKPIEAISATAADISLSNLSRRIDVTGTETELTGLARTLNQMFDRIEAAFSQQVRFTADASHELRTPLAVILSHTELALSRPRPIHELRETVETCRRSAVRMKSLVESLLTLARFDSGEMQLEHRIFDLSRTTGDCIALVRPLADQRGISIRMELPPTNVSGDPDSLSQVVTNLLTNAIRYNQDRGQVSVSIHAEERDIVLRVSDTGIGIPEEYLPHVFERFFRVDKARTRKDGGVGLGLAICRSIAEAHGGTIGVSSTLNQGTTFEVRLPKEPSGPPAEPGRVTIAGEEMSLVNAAGQASSQW